MQSITSINILKRDSGSDTEIGKSVVYKAIDITTKKKLKGMFKNAIDITETREEWILDVLHDNIWALKKGNPIVITSDEPSKLDGDEGTRLKFVLEILAALKVSRVSVLRGGLKEYLQSRNNL